MNSCMQATEVLAVTPVPQISHAPTATSSFARNVWLGCLYVFHGTNRRNLQRSIDLCLPASIYEIKKAGGKDCSKDASSGISFTMFHMGPQAPI